MNVDTPLSCRVLLALSVAAGLICVAVLLATSPGLPMVWDEGNAIRRAEGITQWVGNWFPGDDQSGEPRPWTEQAIERDWQYTTQVEGHPAFYGIVIATGRAVSAGWLTPLSSARFGPIVLFGLAAAAMFYRLGRQFSLPAAAFAIAAMLLLPRLFAHLHFASYDGPLTSCWLLAWAAFDPACRRAGWAVTFGIALGMTLSVKATGWLAPAPFVVWAACYRDRAAAKALALALPAAVLTFYVLNPPLWHHPIDGARTFFELNLHRAAQGWNIPTQFFGRMYDVDHPLPWYNTLVWTAVTVPLPLLLLFVLGMASVLRRPGRNRVGMLLVANWLVLIVVRALPGVPPHDGVRLFLPSFAFLAALAGVGAAWVMGTAWKQRSRVSTGVARSERSEGRGMPIDHALRSSGRATRTRSLIPSLQSLIPLLLCAAAATSLVWYAPHWLSYYNLSVGGLRGATALGMEPTYYWDGLDDSVLDWLHQNTPEGDKIRFAAGPSENLGLMRQWGTLRRDFDPRAPGRSRWYVLQRRPSAWQPADRWLIEHGTPSFRKMPRHGGIGPWRLDVPLVEVYPYQEYLRAREASDDGGESSSR